MSQGLLFSYEPMHSLLEEQIIDRVWVELFICLYRVWMKCVIQRCEWSQISVDLQVGQQKEERFH